jgi:GT2 family glycosyltransferase
MFETAPAPHSETLILQSYRTHDVPPWIATCLDTVRAWAERHTFGYHFLDDSLFSYAPAWARERFGAHLFALTDLARLHLIKAGLQQGYRRVVWIDADVLVFDPARFSIAMTGAFAFCREHMLAGQPNGSVRAEAPGINNAVMAFTADQPVLDFYLYAAESRLRRADPRILERTALGPDLLRRLAAVLPLETFTQVGLFTPLLLGELASGETRMARLYAQQARTPLAAANLCHFARHEAAAAERPPLDLIYRKAVDILLATRGGVVNRHLTATADDRPPAPACVRPRPGAGTAGISVIIPARNMARFLPDAVASIRRQDRPIAEILIVDAGSTDDTEAAVAALAAAGAPVRRIAAAPCNPAAARNLGLAAAQGAVIGFLDADDLWPEDKLARQCARLEATPSVEMVSGHVQFFDRLDPARLAPDTNARTQTAYHVYVGACLYRRAVFERIGGFDESLQYCEDIDLMQRLREQAVPFTILRAVTLYYRRHPDAMMATRHPRQAEDYRRAQRLSAARRNAAGEKTPLAPFDSFLEADGS